jgi:ATP-binding cassette, subfamily B, bacterial
VQQRNGRRIASLFKPYKGRLAAVLLLIIVSAGLGMVSPFLLRGILDTAIPDQDRELLTVLVVGMIAIAIVTGVLSVAQTWLSNVVGQKVMHDLRAAVYRHLQRLSLAFFTRTRTGEVQSRIANDIGGVQTVVTSTATSIVSNVTTVLATIVAMVLLDWRLAVISLALLPFFVWLTRRVGNERKVLTSQRQGRLADMSTLVEESLSVSGVLLGKTMGRSAALADRFEKESEGLAELMVRQQMAGRWRMSTVQMSFAIMPAIVYWLAGQPFATTGANAISIGTVVAFTTLQTRLFFPIGQLLSVGIDIQTSGALFERIFEYLDLPVDLEEGTVALGAGSTRVRGEVRLEHVGFTYEPGGTAILEDVDLVVPAGSTTAIVGETGAGKTTVGYLVARLYDPTSGAVTVDGVDLRDLTFPSLTDTVGLVSQDTYLFHASVRENLRFARPDATDSELEAAARAAQIHNLISSLPDGFDTVVGERGHRFSGGEQQRLAIARTILRNPPVLVLDEATSALDNETEALVQQALESLSEGRTTIAIAHRLSTVRNADQIVVLDHGRVAERGTHDELLALGGRYAGLVARAGVSTLIQA